MSDFSTINESSLHNTLKIFYATKTDGLTEVEKNGYIYDIVTKNNDVIEIQTKNLSKLHDKIKDTIEKDIKVTLVYPLVINTRIILTDENGKQISNRKSPKKGNYYDLLKELTGLYDILLNKNFTLEVLNINMIEHRVRTPEAVQTKNKNRRFKRNWLKVNKRLEEILSVKQFRSSADYLALLPQNLPEEFCAKDIKEAFIKTKEAPAILYNNSNIFTWLFSRMELIEYTKTEKKSKYYRVK